MASCFRYVLLLLLAAPIGVRAQAVLDTTVALPHVTVTGRTAPLTSADAPARITALDSEDIRASGAQHVASLLAQRGSAFVKSYGGGGLSTLSLRGAGSAQTLVLLDGHRIADPQLGELDLSLLPTLLLRSVEVLHGAGSALYGSDALGGVVNLRTRVPSSGWEAALLGGYGAFGERTGALALTGGTGRWGGILMGEYATQEGDYSYLDASRFPPERVPRRGADRTRRSLYGSLRYHPAQGRLRLSGWYQDAERGLPTIGGTKPRGERQWDEHLRLWADARLPRNWGVLRLGGLVQRAALRYLNPQQAIDQTSRTLTTSLRGSASFKPGPRWRLRSGLAGSFSRARHPELSAGARQSHLGIFARGTGRYGPFRLYPALRLDGYALPDGPTRLAASPRMGLNARLFTSPFRFKASAGRAFRIPTFNDRFWQPGGNPDLRPERSWNADAGLFAGNARRHAELTMFARWTRDKIVWHATEAGYWTADNIGRTRTLGLEASLEGQRTFGPLKTQGGLFYTLTDARNRANPDAPTYDQPLRYVPRHKLKGHLTAGAGPAALDLNARYVGRRHLTSDGGPFLDPYLVVDAQLRLSWQIRDTELLLAGQLENAFDARYAVLENRPMPPRHARLRLTVRL